jgi:hypothetical protein
MDVTYRFVASGHESVAQAFKGIEDRAKASKKATDDANKSARKATSPAGSRQRSRSTETDRAAAAEARAAARTASARERAEDASHRRLIASGNRRYAERLRQVDAYAKQEQRTLERARRAQAKGGGLLGRVGEHAATAVTGVAIGAAITAAAVAGKALKEAATLDDVSRGFAISGRKAGGQFADFGAIRRGIQTTAAGTPGVESEALARGLASFQALTGESGFALRAQGTFATAASASGADPVKIAEAAASMFQHFDITGLEEMQEAMATLHFQGKAGAIELENAADLLQSLAAAGKGAGLEGGIGGVKSLGGLLQIARGGTGSAAMAGHAVENIFRALKEKQNDLAAAGVTVYDKKSGKLTKPIEDLLAETISKVGGSDLAKKQDLLSKIFGTEGGRGLNPLAGEYLDVFNKTAGSQADKQKAAMEAVRQKLLEARNATGSYAEMQKDAAMRQKAASAQLTAAWEAVKLSIGDVALPALQGLADKLGPAAKELAKDLAPLEAARKGSKAEAAALRSEVAKSGSGRLEKAFAAGAVGFGDLDAAQIAKLRQAQTILSTATGKDAASRRFQAGIAAGAVSFADLGKGDTALTREQFIKQYAQGSLDSQRSGYASLFGLGGAVGTAVGMGLDSMGYFTGSSDAEDALAAEKHAGAVWDQLAKSKGQLGTMQSAAYGMQETDAMAQLRGRAASDIASGKVSLDTADAQQAIGELAAASRKAAGDMRASQQGSIVTGQ